MTRLLSTRVRSLSLVCLIAIALVSAPAASELRVGTPASVGMSAERLARLDAAMENEISSGRKAGIVVLIARKGQIVHHKAYGMADVAAGRKMQTDSLVRLYSMTKPVTSVALLTLYEQGKFLLTDPLDKHIPAFANLKVMTGTRPDGSLRLEDPKRQPTIQDVFRHTAGFVYGFNKGPVDDAYREAKVNFGTMTSLKDMIGKLSTLPLLYHPGEQWVYSVSHDVQAYLVEHFSGKPFDQYVRETVINPLKLTDMVFGVPKTQPGSIHGDLQSEDRRRPGSQGERRRHGREERDDRRRLCTLRNGSLWRAWSVWNGALSYARFAQMLLTKGELDGVRILSRKTVELMTMNHLPASIPSIGTAGDNGIGYGLGVSVVIDPAREGVIDSAGQFGWGGAASTKVFIDPKESMVVVVLTQYMPFDANFLSLAQTLAYQAIAD